MSGKAVIFSAPSGAGKTTIVNHLIEIFPSLRFSVSATSRAKRKNEIDGKNYHFLTQEDFKKRIENDDFAEWQEVYPGVFYGTLKSEIENILGDNNTIIFDVDVVGGLNLKKYMGNKALACFVQPPDLETITQRLNHRNTETTESLTMRLKKTEYEMTFAPQFDKIIVNNNLQTAFNQAELLVSEFLKND